MTTNWQVYKTLIGSTFQSFCLGDGGIVLRVYTPTVLSSALSAPHTSRVQIPRSSFIIDKRSEEVLFLKITMLRSWA